MAINKIQYKSFSSNWSKSNILINVEKNFISNYFLGIFFSTWHRKTLTTTKSIVVNFRNKIHNSAVIDKNFFSYKRIVDTDGVIYTQIIKIKWVRKHLVTMNHRHGKPYDPFKRVSNHEVTSDKTSNPLLSFDKLTSATVAFVLDFFERLVLLCFDDVEANYPLEHYHATDPYPQILVQVI